MSDPNRRYPPPPSERDPFTAFTGHLPYDGASAASNHAWPGDPRGPSEFLRNDILPLGSGSYGLDDHNARGTYATPGLPGLAPGASMRAFSPLEDPTVARRAEVERATSTVKPDGLTGEESNILFVDGLPTDCTRREVSHIFRPFIGFKDIRVVHKEPRRTGDKAYVLCFVEFSDAKCALTAMEALQGYRFDDKKTDAPVLGIQFAKFPFRPSAVTDDKRQGSVR
uniref:RRM domain-containing protein n=1 Tax=Ananas comosus var. bracteatus TaxID=296719 RepID=A0A6V7QR82_ANACO